MEWSPWLLKGVREKMGMRREPQEVAPFDSVVGSSEETFSIGIFMTVALLINGEQLRRPPQLGKRLCLCRRENSALISQFWMVS